MLVDPSFLKKEADKSVPLYEVFKHFEIKPVDVSVPKKKAQYEKIPCLKCTRIFRSVCRKSNRLCPKCRRSNKKAKFGSRTGGESFFVKGSNFSHLNRDPSVSDVVDTEKPKE